VFQKCVLSALFHYFGDAFQETISCSNTLLYLTCSYLALYFDFSGYSDIAMGIAWLFGVRFPLNFNQPLRATSLADFWARWHITLTSFIKNYVYFSALRAWPNNVTFHRAAMILCMFLVGIWHEPSRKFAAFGLAHGVALVLWPTVRPDTRLKTLLLWALTQGFVILSLAFFAAPDFPAACELLSGLGKGLGAFSSSVAFDHYDQLQVCLCIALTVAHIISARNTLQLFGKAKPSGALFLWFVVSASLSLLYLNSGLSRDFIYADF